MCFKKCEKCGDTYWLGTHVVDPTHVQFTNFRLPGDNNEKAYERHQESIAAFNNRKANCACNGVLYYFKCNRCFPPPVPKIGERIEELILKVLSQMPEDSLENIVQKLNLIDRMEENDYFLENLQLNAENDVSGSYSDDSLEYLSEKLSDHSQAMFPESYSDDFLENLRFQKQQLYSCRFEKEKLL